MLGAIALWLDDSYHLASMRHEILLAPDAIAALKRLDARTRAEIRDAIERHLRWEPTRTSRSRIKRLRGRRQPQYRLRAGEYRVFYDVDADRVEILAIIAKSRAAQWLEEESEP